MKKYLVLVYVSGSLLFSLCARAQQVCRWDVCDDTTPMIFETNQAFSAAAANDIAEIGSPIWDDTSHSPRRIVRQTTDSGKTWKQLFRNDGWTDEWHAISHPTNNFYIITGDSLYPIASNIYRHHAYLLLSSDAGVSWRHLYWDTNTTIRCLQMLNENYGIAILDPVGNVHDTIPDLLPSQLLVTQDGWKTWTSTSLSAAHGFYQLFCFAPGVFGGIAYNGYSNNQNFSEYLKTTNGGLTWDSFSTLLSAENVCFVNEKLGWGAGRGWSTRFSQSLIVHTTDGGVTWSTQLDSNMSVMHGADGVSHIAFADSLHGFAVGYQILETSDGGCTWNSNKPPFEIDKLDGAGNGAFGGLKGLIMPSPSLAFFACGGPVLRYSGKHRLQAPIFDKHEYGPLPIEPTTISWSRIKGADHYRVQLDTSSSDYGATVTYFDAAQLDTVVRDTFFAFTPKARSNYYARVQAIAEGDSSDWRWNDDWYELPVMFQTVKKAGAALPPTIVSPPNGSHATSNEVKVVWTSVPGALRYHIDCFCINLTDSTTTTDTFATFSGLTYDAQYYFSVKALLSDDTTAPAYVTVFIDQQAGANSGAVQSAVLAYPNPAHDVIHLALPEEIRNSEFELCDLLGHAMAIDPVRETSGVRIDVHTLPNGLYTLRIPGNKYSTIRVIVQH
jgi:photosystem II stability/assembly factor-like uncharacterized protein